MSPTAGVVANPIYDYFGGNVINATWTTVISVTVPDVSVENYFLFVSASMDNAGLSGSANVACRIYDETTGKYYPLNDVSDTTQENTYVNFGMTNIPINFFFTIPENVKNHTLRVQIRHNHGATRFFRVFRTGWGHSQHTHR